MIEFMVIAAPRSGTTWVSNWLTTDTTLCLHDPLYQIHYEDFDKLESSKVLGISCTGMGYFPDWLNAHPSRKVILHRDLSEINKSMEAIGLPSIEQNYLDSLSKINGIHVDWMDIFNNPKDIYEYLTGFQFNEERHALLRGIEMQPKFSGLKVGHEVTKRLMQELGEIKWLG